jgi:hypothetical protein
MRVRSNIIPALLALGVSWLVAGCGDGNNDNIILGLPTSTPTPASGRTSTPVRTATPANGATETPTPAEGVPTETATPGGPAATPTPVAGACVDGNQVVVVASLTQAYGAAVINLEYPASVNIPGTGTAATVVASVQFAASGVTNVSDGDMNGDSVDDTLIAGLLSLSANPAGTFVTVTFDCVAGQAPPASAAFTCSVVSASDPDGVQIPNEQCTLNVTGP